MLLKRRSGMKFRHAFIGFAGIFIAAGFAATQAGAKSEPGCTDASGNTMQIEVNALRVSGGTIAFGPGKFANVASKARILKGTAVADATLDMTLRIEAVDGTEVIRTSSTGPITLGVGKGGKGAKLSMEIVKCDAGFIEFVATFFGVDADNDVCEGTRTIRKQCK
jgi:hypothetical protein